MTGAAWYAARSAGILAYLLLSSSVVLGVLMSARARFAWPRFAVEEVHRFLAILTAVFVTIHGGSLLLDRVVPFSLGQELIPFTAGYRPFAVGLGVVAAELMAAVGLTNALRKHVPHHLWRRAHYLTLGVWGLSTIHALLVGTDRRDPWMLGLMALAVTSVSLAFLVRFAREAGTAAVAGIAAAAGVSVLALAFAPQ